MLACFCFTAVAFWIFFSVVPQGCQPPTLIDVATTPWIRGRVLGKNRLAQNAKKAGKKLSDRRPDQMKSMLSGSAFIAAALLSSSLLLSAKPSIAETLLSVGQQQQSDVQQLSAKPAEPSQAAPTQKPSTPQPAQPPQPPSPPSSPSEPAQSAPTSEPSSPQPKASPIDGRATGMCLSSNAGLVVDGSDSANSTKPNQAAAPNLVSRPVSRYLATAYSLKGRTASGKFTTRGVIAADPSVLPLGSRVHLEVAGYTGEYLVADTGGAVRGRRIDIWTPSTREALRFGRRTVKLTVLCYGARRSSLKRRIRA